jgi:hypothetical protein
MPPSKREPSRNARTVSELKSEELPRDDSLDAESSFESSVGSETFDTPREGEAVRSAAGALSYMHGGEAAHGHSNNAPGGGTSSQPQQPQQQQLLHDSARGRMHEIGLDDDGPSELTFDLSLSQLSPNEHQRQRSQLSTSQQSAEHEVSVISGMVRAAPPRVVF